MSRESLKQDQERGPLVIVKGKELAAAGTTGVVAKGKYLGSKVNIVKGKPLTSYQVRDEATDTLYLINSTKALADQLNGIKAEDNISIEVVYNGCKDTNNGNTFHDFEVFKIS